MFLLVLLFFASSGFAVSEERMPSAIDDVILPFYENQLQSGVFEGTSGVTIGYVKFEVPEERGALVIVNGRTESYIKYAELIYDLREARFSIYSLDHRGQGFSGRMLNDPQKGHVENFEDYVADLHTFFRTVVNERDHARRFILAHSMGGAIAGIYAAKYPENLDGMILSAPMMQINSGPVPQGVVSFMASVLTALGMGNAYVPGGRKYDPDSPFIGNSLTHSRKRYDMTRMLISRYPQTALGSPTNRWLREALKACREVRRAATKIQIPILLLQPGMDRVVKAGAQDDFCDRAGNCRKVTFPEARHEILMEEDKIRDEAISRILDFLNKDQSFPYTQQSTAPDGKLP